MAISKDDPIYEIAATDAWRSLIQKLDSFRVAFEREVVQTAAKQGASVADITRASGRAEAANAILKEFISIGKNNG